MRARVVLWIAFLVVHVGVAALGWAMPGATMGDVYIVYEPWATNAVTGARVVGVTEPFVYPHLALVAMILAKALSWVGGYLVAWALLVIVLNAIAFAVLIGRGHSRGRTAAAWFWLVAIVLLGPVGMYRIDAITVPLAILGLLWLAGRPAIASVLLAVGMWIKVWPVALLATAFVAVRRRMLVLGAAVAVSAAVMLVVVALGGAEHLFGFVGEQTGRGLQVEAPVATFYLWRAMLGMPGSHPYYSQDILTYQVDGPGADVLSALMTPLLVVAAAGVLVLGGYKSWRGAHFVRLAPPLALAFVMTLIVVNKVGSPQFMTWLFAPIVFWIVVDRTRAWFPALLGALTIGLTQLVYPLFYGAVLSAVPYGVLLLTLRNVLSIVLLVFAVAVVARVPAPGRIGRGRPRSDAAIPASA